MSTFRFTRAEFIKIFKKPSAYIMAVFLLACVVVAYFIYTPQVRSSYLASYQIDDNTTVSTIYNIYNSGISGDVKSVYENNFNSAKNILEFYKTNTNRIDNLTNAYNDLDIRYKNMAKADTEYDKAIANGQTADSTLLQKTVQEYKDALYMFNTSIAEVNTLKNSLVGANEYIGTDIYSEGLAKINEVYDYLQETVNYNLVYDYLNINNIQTTFKTFFSKTVNYQESTIDEYIGKIVSSKDAFVEAINNNNYNDGNSEVLNQKRLELVDLLNNLSKYVNLLVDNESYNYPIVLIEKSDMDNFTQNFNAIMSTLKSENDSFLSTMSDYRAMVQTFNNTTILSDMINSLDSITYLQMDINKATELEDYYNNTIMPLNQSIVSEIEALKSDLDFFNSKNSADLEKMIYTISKQKDLSTNTKDLFNAEINNYFLGNIANDDINKLYGFDFSNYNNYENQENIAKLRYLIDHGSYNFEYNEVFSNDYTSGAKESAYDFTFFVLSLSVVFITIFSIFMITNLIASENDNGTIKMILTRPYKRYKIVTGKMLATLSFACVFVLFITIVAFCTGWGLFGANMTNVLAVFSAKYAMSINPLLLMLIYMISCILKITFFIVLATMITVLCKSFPFSIIVNFLTYAVIFILNILLGGYGWYAYVPFGELMFFNYFGGAFRVFGNNNFISMLISSPFVGQVSWWLSSIITIASMAIMLAITYRTFNRRDF